MKTYTFAGAIVAFAYQGIAYTTRRMYSISTRPGDGRKDENTSAASDCGCIALVGGIALLIVGRERLGRKRDVSTTRSLP